MDLFRTERAALERHLPGLDKQLAELPLADLERPGSPGLGLFREAGGPALLVPAEHGGLGASALDAVRVQRAVGARSPSLAVATTMHHFSVASLAEMAAATDGMAWAMLQAVAENRWLLSSGFAEGKPGQHILTPSMRGTPVPGGLRVSGSKKPCSLTWSMDLLSASVAVDGAGGTRLAVVLVPAVSEGITRRPFWGTPVLAGAESDEVVLDGVFVPEQLVIYPDGPAGMDPVQTRGFVWFETLISASYVGAASALLERVVTAGRGTALDRVTLAADLDAATAALERVALALQGEDVHDSDLLGRALCVRYAVEQTLARVSDAALALAGGIGFIGSPDLAYLLAACRPLSFHPPSRVGAAQALDAWLGGERLVL